MILIMLVDSNVSRSPTPTTTASCAGRAGRPPASSSWAARGPLICTYELQVICVYIYIYIYVFIYICIHMIYIYIYVYMYCYITYIYIYNSRPGCSLTQLNRPLSLALDAQVIIITIITSIHNSLIIINTSCIIHNT